MAKHTPGPWYIDSEGDICARHDGRLIACLVYNADEPDDLIRLGEGEANARLIAAAPELLKALEYVAERVLAQHALNLYEANALMRARAAIAKATEE